MAGTRGSLLVGLLGWLAVAQVSQVRAGVYNFAEPRVFASGDKSATMRHLKFRLNLLKARDVTNVTQWRRSDPDRPIPGHVEGETDALQRHLLVMHLHDRSRWPRLSETQKLNLSGYLLQCGMAEEARDLLEHAVRVHPDNFFLFANLATAYAQLGERERGQYERAIVYQEAALAAWPEHFDALKPEQKRLLAIFSVHEGEYHNWRRAEELYLDLLKTRQLEQEKGVAEYADVDALFRPKKGEPLRFVNEAGEYEPGKLAAVEKAKLPKNALDDVQQLLLWTPLDNRLLWLYGELLAAEGDIKNAQDVFEKDLRPLMTAKEFKRHREALLKTKAPPEEVETSIEPPTVDEMMKKLDKLDPATRPYPWRDVFLAFAIGIAVGLFAYWQFREIRRRHQRGAARP